MTASDQHTIDILIEQYLHLLDEYSQLRQNLSTLQSNVYHQIARANFAAERGMRYGPDHYDERMQSSRLLSISMSESGLPDFSIRNQDEPAPPGADTAGEPEKGDGAASDAKPSESNPTEKHTKPKKDPLHWFGLLVPQSLRAAQSQSVQVVEGIIPRLVTVNTEMAHLEIEIRRARKRRAKAEAAKNKSSEQTYNAEGQATAST
ncbi:hypothetical protein B0I35DRAFT_480036 [Stachybotrys elegans]|uniref:Vacuolar ATPase assembly protein VMA22 n=1 Tax=Stachybotrys elegans TaxID=80388 RepID=A0A8K0SIF7_9HYPO|nr:hypothetical protein B0I35DRAFT_480036 [Stachybotrys elegans]